MKKIVIVLSIIALYFFFTGCEVVTTPDPTPTPTEEITSPPTETPVEPPPTTTPPVSVFSLSGRVIYNSIGLPETGLLLSGSSEDFTAVSDEEGNFVFDSVPQGIYTLYAEKTGFSFTPSTYYVDLNQNISNRNFTGGAASGFHIDPWGYAWDDSLRAANTWTEATALCESRGGRLPTATELYRNYHGNAHGLGGTISQPDESYYLWTNIDHSQNYAVAVRLSDGAVTYYAKTTNLYFRCVWPDKEYDTFRRSYVYGPPGETGFQVEINGGLFYMDTYDRPPVTYNSAVREAAFYHAYIPPQSVFTAVIRDGLPNGSNQWVWTSDQEGYNGTQFLAGVVRWSNIDPNYNDTYSTYSGWAYETGSYPYRFRCAGVSSSLQASPKYLANEYLDPGSLLKTTRGNQGAVTMFDALQACFNSGGHLPTHQEYMILVQSGLPNGPGSNWLWTSDYEDDGYVGVIRWTNVDTEFNGYYSTYMSWAGHTTQTYQYRAVYYPLDEDYSGPSESDCCGGRFEVEKDLGSGYTVRMWSDMYDRDAATYQDAVQQCHDLGGHLASRRDLVELIVNGLPNGSGGWVWTSDKARYDQAEVLRWTGTYDPETPTFGDRWSTDATEVTQNGTVMYSFRCVWTNEVRIR